MRFRTQFVIAAAILALGTIFVAGCNASKSDSTTDQAPATSPDKKVPDLSREEDKDLGETVAYTNEKGELVCPVLGDVIPSADKAAGFQDYKGKRYYFCCAGCPEKFAADPEKYAK